MQDLDTNDIVHSVFISWEEKKKERIDFSKIEPCMVLSP